MQPPKVPKVCLFISKFLRWQPLYQSQHIVSIYISARDHLFFVHNVYNNPGPGNQGVHDLQNALDAANSVSEGALRSTI